MDNKSTILQLEYGERSHSSTLHIALNLLFSSPILHFPCNMTFTVLHLSSESHLSYDADHSIEQQERHTCGFGLGLVCAAVVSSYA